MALKTNNRKRISPSTEYKSAIQLAESVLQSAKLKTGKVIHVVVNGRTTIELPAHFTQEQIDARVANYKKLRKLNI